MSNMVKLTIEGREVEVPAGTSVLEAAKLAGVLIPHYCYHPSLPVAGVCRMCLVEIEKQPKLAASCATAVAEGMVVRIESEQAKKARQSVLEFLLINHPLDCPICDQAGECELQDYVFQEGRAGTRYSEYAKRFNPVEDFGPDVLYVPNRCILCTRCVRFMEHVADEPVLNVSERGDRAYIGIHEGQKLDHEWAGNVVDLCPVGSLISKDFLHKARAWDLDRTASVCPGCTQGCSIMLETRDNTVVRVKPRPNPEVNRHFICDEGRLGYAWLNRTDRLEVPMVRDGGGKLVASDWDHALERVAEVLREAKEPWLALVSPGASNEALERIMALIRPRQGRGAFRVRTGPEAPLAGVNDLKLRAERAPNVYGALAAGFTREWEQTVAAAAGAGLVLVLDESLEGTDGKLGAAPLVWLGTTLPEPARARATVALPIANMAEEEGTFRNVQGRDQQYLQAKTAPGLARPAAWVLDRIAAELGATAGAR
ncbi:MAG TPA: 2Fe-2S iron-sulfur cluster-binding protein [Gemmatimonadales bacterium]|nr:2Fe-2S iron-sulfur cluster-binding protein [Gemmatimonadales bacterium]